MAESSPTPIQPTVGLNEKELGDFPLSDVDRLILSMTDEEYKLHDWDELREVIATNNLSVLKRKPSDLRRYIAWTLQTNRTYGSTTSFLLATRLPQAWGPPPFTPASQIPLADEADYCILRNDWPYGFEDGITHLVVWTRTGIPVDGAVGGLTAESRALVEAFVRRVFVRRLEGQDGGKGERSGNGAERVLWFKNWGSLQSVRALEHFHVLVRDVPEEIVEEWTGEKRRVLSGG